MMENLFVRTRALAGPRILFGLTESMGPRST